MLCASTKASTTNSTGRTPARVNTRRSGRWRPAACPAKSGRRARTQTMSASASTLMRPKHSRQPTHWPSTVPAGTPSDSASGVPTMAMAMARPLRWPGTMRAA